MTAINFRVWYIDTETKNKMQIIQTVFDAVDYMEAAHSVLLNEYKAYKADETDSFKPYRIDLVDIVFM